VNRPYDTASICCPTGYGPNTQDVLLVLDTAFTPYAKVQQRIIDDLDKAGIKLGRPARATWVPAPADAPHSTPKPVATNYIQAVSSRDTRGRSEANRITWNLAAAGCGDEGATAALRSGPLGTATQLRAMVVRRNFPMRSLLVSTRRVVVFWRWVLRTAYVTWRSPGRLSFGTTRLTSSWSSTRSP